MLASTTAAGTQLELTSVAPDGSSRCEHLSASSRRDRSDRSEGLERRSFVSGSIGCPGIGVCSSMKKLSAISPGSDVRCVLRLRSRGSNGIESILFHRGGAENFGLPRTCMTPVAREKRGVSSSPTSEARLVRSPADLLGRIGSGTSPVFRPDLLGAVAGVLGPSMAAMERRTPRKTKKSGSRSFPGDS
eukprot:7384743-Prymnesium_polylepis.2